MHINIAFIRLPICKVVMIQKLHCHNEKLPKVYKKNSPKAIQILLQVLESSGLLLHSIWSNFKRWRVCTSCLVGVAVGGISADDEVGKDGSNKTIA